MAQLWLLKGDLDAPGWQSLRADYDAEQVEIVHLDPKVWALVQADTPPESYDGLQATEPPDGVYVDPNGNPLYLVDGAAVADGMAVVGALGDEASRLLEALGDADRVLERLGRAY